MNLVNEYRLGKKELEIKVREFEKQIAELKLKNKDEVDNLKLHIDTILDLETRKRNLNAMIDNLNYGIEWMEKGHEPNTYIGIENLKASKKYDW